MGDDDGLVDVYLSVAVRTSAGPGPGPKRLPPAEAADLIKRKAAVYGTQPPRGFEDGGADGRTIAAMMPRTP